MFGTVLTTIGTLLHLYVFWRASSVPFLRRHVRPKTIAGMGLALWVFFVIGRLVGHGEAGAAANILELVSMTWLASLFLACVCLVIVELVTGLGFLLPRHAPALRGWALVVGAGLSIFALIQGLRPPAVESYEVQIAGLPPELDGTVLVAMSDLHLGSLLGEGWLADRVDQVQALRPDLVVLLGDVFEGHGRPQEELVAELNRLSAPSGVWAVPGNHESWAARDGVSPFGGQSGIQVLRNRWTEIRPGLILAGVEDLTAAGRAGQNSLLAERALEGRPPGATILLSHTPLADRSRSRARRGVNALRAYSRWPDMALGLPGPHPISVGGRSLRSGRHDCARLPGNRNLGAAHATVAPWGDHAGYPAGKEWLSAGTWQWHVGGC